MLTKESILKVEDLKFEEVKVSEWGGTVRIRSMSGMERDSFEAEIYVTKGADIELNRENFRAKLLVRTIVDENNVRLFTDKDAKELGQKSIIPLDRLFTVAQKLNALTSSDIEELTKNSEAEQENSISSCPAN